MPNFAPNVPFAERGTMATIAQTNGQPHPSNCSRAMKYLFTVLTLVLCSSALHAKPHGIPPKRTGTMAEAMSGRSLSPDQVSLLEFAVAANPDDLSIHTKLLGYYFLPRLISADAKVAYRKHILWIIKNHPEAE